MRIHSRDGMYSQQWLSFEMPTLPRIGRHLRCHTHSRHHSLLCYDNPRKCPGSDYHHIDMIIAYLVGCPFSERIEPGLFYCIDDNYDAFHLHGSTAQNYHLQTSYNHFPSTNVVGSSYYTGTNHHYNYQNLPTYNGIFIEYAAYVNWPPNSYAGEEGSQTGDVHRCDPYEDIAVFYGYHWHGDGVPTRSGVFYSFDDDQEILPKAGSAASRTTTVYSEWTGCNFPYTITNHYFKSGTTGTHKTRYDYTYVSTGQITPTSVSYSPSLLTVCAVMDTPSRNETTYCNGCYRGNLTCPVLGYHHTIAGRPHRISTARPTNIVGSLR